MTDSTAIRAEIDGHIAHFTGKNPKAVARWQSVIDRLDGNGGITDAELRVWMGQSERYGWRRGLQTLPKAMEALGLDAGPPAPPKPASPRVSLQRRRCHVIGRLLGNGPEHEYLNLEYDEWVPTPAEATQYSSRFRATEKMHEVHGADLVLRRDRMALTRWELDALCREKMFACDPLDQRYWWFALQNAWDMGGMATFGWQKKVDAGETQFLPVLGYLQSRDYRTELQFTVGKGSAEWKIMEDGRRCPVPQVPLPPEPQEFTAPAMNAFFEEQSRRSAELEGQLDRAHRGGNMATVMQLQEKLNELLQGPAERELRSKLAEEWKALVPPPSPNAFRAMHDWTD